MGKSLESRFDRYADRMVEALGHADRAMPARWYLRGLMLPGERKSVDGLCDQGRDCLGADRGSARRRDPARASAHRCGLRMVSSCWSGSREVKKLPSTQNASPTRRLPPAWGCVRCSGTSPGRSPPRAFAAQGPSPDSFRNAHAAENPACE